MCVFSIVGGWVIVAFFFSSGWGEVFVCVYVVFLVFFFCFFFLGGGGGGSVCGGLRVGCFSLRCMIGLCISCLNILIIPHCFACACRCCSFV